MKVNVGRKKGSKSQGADCNIDLKVEDELEKWGVQCPFVDQTLGPQ